MTANGRARWTRRSKDGMKLTKFSGDPRTEGQHIQDNRLDAEIKTILQKRALVHGKMDTGIQARPIKPVTNRPTGTHFGRTVGDDANAGLVNTVPQKGTGEKRLDYYQDPSTFVLGQDPKNTPYGMREDQTPKGEGYFGKIKRLDNPSMFSTELSASTEFKLNGRAVLFPLLVPTLSREEIDHLVSGKEPTDAITQKAEAFARQRIAKGLSPFAGSGEQGQVPDMAQQQFQQGFQQEQGP